MWNNREWAERHIRKHNGDPTEAWDAVFHDDSVVPIRAEDQLNWPPFRRWWTIGATRAGRKLFVVWDQHRGVRNLITAFEPDEVRQSIYERKKKLLKKS
jgi:hypothetical protein